MTVTVTVTVKDVRPLGEICIVRAEQVSAEVKSRGREGTRTEGTGGEAGGRPRQQVLAGEVDHWLVGSSASATALSRERQGHAYNFSRRR